MNLNENLLEVRDLSVNFSKWGHTVKALDRISFSVSKGQWVMLVGHNGSGKSTLFKTICGLIRPNIGDVLIQGDNIHKLSNPQIAEHVFLVYQDPILGTGPTLTLFENLMVADRSNQHGNISRKKLFESYHELLRPLGLSDRLKQLARNLSVGERQLLALSVARLRPSSLMLLDEPLASLDPANAELCLDQIKKLYQDGKTILQVTHDSKLAIEEGDRTIVMAHGKTIFDETEINKRRNLGLTWSNHKSWK